MQNFMTPGGITVHIPKRIEYSVYAHGDIIDITIWEVIVRVQPDSIGVSYEGSTECASVYAPKQDGDRFLGYIQGCARDQNLTARWDSAERAARLDVWFDRGMSIVVTMKGNDVTIEVPGLPSLDELIESIEPCAVIDG